jgi:predicted oxidoreductase
MAWSPFAGGRLATSVGVNMRDPDHARKLKVHDALESLARERSISRFGLALAWLLRHPAGIVPVVGTTNPERIQEAARADEIQLSREEWYRLYEAAYGQHLP